MTYRHLTSHMPELQGIRHWEGEPSTPLFPFGHGLTYGDVRYESLTVDVASGLPEPRVDCSVTLTNAGQLAADEVVQLYVHQRCGRSAQPVRALKAFRRVALKPGETRTLTLTLGVHELQSWSEQDRAWGIDAATFDIWVGASSEATMHADFALA
jgi:beta-glucosidase